MKKKLITYMQMSFHNNLSGGYLRLEVFIALEICNSIKIHFLIIK